MGDALIRRESRDQIAASAAEVAHQCRSRIAAIAATAAAALSAGILAIAWDDHGIESTVRAPGHDSKWSPLVADALSALEYRLSDRPASRVNNLGNLSSDSSPPSRLLLSPRDLAAIADTSKLADAGLQLLALAYPSDHSAIRIVVITPDRLHKEVEASLELLANAVFLVLARSLDHSSLELWRSRGPASAREAIDANKALDHHLLSARNLDDAVSELRAFRPHQRFAQLAAMLARRAGFDDWIIAVPVANTVAIGKDHQSDRAITIAASAPRFERIDAGASDSALARCLSNRIALVHPAGRIYEFAEDRIFRGDYLCLPFEAGAVALAARGPVPPEARIRAEAILERVSATVKSWMLEAQLARSRALVNRLALRIFSAVDEERMKIARDLHDDQAQLLAAAKIALEGGRDEAREILKQIEDELRRKTRSLRPATLGRASLRDAIEHQFERLHTAGVKATLNLGPAANAIARPLQQLCFQVIREALSNVIRHASAKSVEVTIVRIDSAVRISVVDDGRGIAGKIEGSGIAGIKERLELMGGSVVIESKACRTNLVAEIPELA